MKDKYEDLDVDKSCGCIFCDFGLQPIKLKRQWIHYIKTKGARHRIICPIKGIKPMSDGSKRGS